MATYAAASMGRHCRGQHPAADVQAGRRCVTSSPSASLPPTTTMCVPAGQPALASSSSHRRILARAIVDCLGSAVESSASNDDVGLSDQSNHGSVSVAASADCDRVRGSVPERDLVGVSASKRVYSSRPCEKSRAFRVSGCRRLRARLYLNSGHEAVALAVERSPRRYEKELTSGLLNTCPPQPFSNYNNQ